MVSSPLVSTLFVLGLAAIAQTTSIHGGHAVHHRGVAERITHPIDLIERQPPSRKINRRRSCKAPSTSSTIVPVTSGSPPETTTTKAAATTTKAAAKTTSTATKVTTTSEDTPATTPASTGTGTTSSSSGSNGGHQFTLINKCSSAVKPVVVSTACGYSPRCADASTAALPSPGSLAAGKTTTITIPNNFVGRIFAQDGSCGAKGESCTMLEFNLDADSFYTPNSYDISNIQGFTQSISLGAEGCSTVTCTSPSCSCNDAYPIGDMTGCGNDLPVKACGKGNIPFTVVFCP
ncbi:Thaumatin-like protein [Mycena venus]|uniref:Thaumatin-like protein n=1 Tax=Mycena venus TaxID=2733690 RepID=A0A8H7D3E6_9AGAR|nr:Thaumatin-like protein [Mycena venus]